MLHSTFIFTFFDVFVAVADLKLNWSKMFMLKLLILSVIFVAVKSHKLCLEEFRVRKEGFKHKNCIPGHYDGSCLLLFPEPVEFLNALKTCHFDYGGRLATADSEDVFKKWTKRIYRDPDFQVNNNTRFWIGYGETDSVSHTFSDMKPDGDLVKPFFQMTYWNKAFGGKTFISDVSWEEEPDFEKLDYFPCGQYATVFNPNNGNFSLRKVEEKHPFLCETPRYPKFKCFSGWHLNPNNRMCIWFEASIKKFNDAYLGCRSIDAIPAVASDSELNALTAVCALHNHGTKGHKIWSGLKLAEGEAQTLDGLRVRYSIEGGGVNFCVAYYGKFDARDGGYYDYCWVEYPYICQRFVDQAFNLKAE